MVSTQARPSARSYDLYGLRLRSEWPLDYAPRSAAWLAEIRLLRGSRSSFSTAIQEARALADEEAWPRGVRLADGRTYLRCFQRFEFLISADGREVTARPLCRESRAAFHAYLLGQVLSIALVKQGFEPLHATTVTIDGAAVAFLGESGFGKSSLGAAFLESGYRLLTDDLLLLSERGGDFIAHPGLPSIKLFPEMARHVLGPAARGTPLAHNTRKSIIPLGERQSSRQAAPLRAIYVLAPPARDRLARTRVTIRQLSWRPACIALLRNTFNTVVTDADRLRRHFAFAARLAAALPVKQIAYPRALDRLPEVRHAILADQSRHVRTCCS